MYYYVQCIIRPTTYKVHKIVHFWNYIHFWHIKIIYYSTGKKMFVI